MERNGNFATLDLFLNKYVPGVLTRSMEQAQAYFPSKVSSKTESATFIRSLVKDPRGHSLIACIGIAESDLPVSQGLMGIRKDP